jgi:myo-inositol-1(or 4)-monophosphatase
MKNIVLPFNLKEEIYQRLDVFEGLLPELKRIFLELWEEDLEIQYKSSDIDLVTKADHLSEQTIIHFLQTRFPMDYIISEESGKKEPIVKKIPSVQIEPSEFTWCIDPLDGTINYSHHIPLFSISVGILYNDLPVGGLVYLPVFNDIYRAVYNDGAYKNHKRIYVSQTSDLKKSLVVTGFPYNRLEILEQLTKTFEKVLKHCRGIRRTGSAALDLCWLAEGRFDAHYEWNLSSWDTAAGIVILREAGGKIVNEKKEDYKPGDKLLIATNKNIHKDFVDLILN